MDKSPTDKRLYRHLLLKNGLKVTLVSDKDSSKTAVAMDVRVGSIDDPPQREGMAHFVEHLLFLGTASYPKPDDFDRFIETHHGTAPAYTDDEHTHYAFDIDAAFTQEGLHRFAEFFFAPLFAKEWIEKERLSIHAEYLQDIKQDGHRFAHVLYAATANPEHPLSRFRVGKNSTLADRPKESLKTALCSFYNRYYTADRMCLSVLGPYTLDQLQDWIAPFEAIAPLRLAPTRTHKPLLRPKELGKHLTICPINQLRELHFYFALPSQQAAYATKPAHVLAYLFAQEGPGSLFEYFRMHSWVEGLHADCHTLTQTQDELYLSIDLTETGLVHIEAITHALFDYIAYLASNTVCEEAYREILIADRRNFLFQEREEALQLVSDLAFHRHFVPEKDLLSCHYILEETYPRDSVEQLLKRLQPAYCRRVLIHKEVETDTQDPYYHTPYQVSTLTLSKHPGHSPRFALTVANPFLPENFKLLPLQKTKKKPSCIFEAPGLTLWHCSTPHFKLPKVDIHLYFRSPTANRSPEQHLLLSFLQSSLIDQLSYYHDRFVLAGVHYQIHKLADGLLCCIHCYSDKLLIILKTFCTLFIAHKPEPTRFAILKAQLLEAIENTENDLPYDVVTEDLETLMTTPDWFPQECLAHEQSLSFSALEHYLAHCWHHRHLLTFIHGNLDTKNAKILATTLYGFLQPHSSTPACVPVHENRFYHYCQLPKGSASLWFSPSKQADPALCFYFQASGHDLKTQALTSLIVQLMGAAFFHQLRTVEQLGYAVLLSEITLGKLCGIRLVIQSSEYTAFKLLERVSTFLESYRSTFYRYTNKDLLAVKTALINALKTPAHYLSELTELYWHDILQGYTSFDTRTQLAEILSTLDITELQRFYEDLFLNPETSRQVVCLTKDNTIPHKKYYSQITNPLDFKASCSLL